MMFTVLKIIRPVNCLIGIIGVLIGGLVSIGPDIFNEQYLIKLILGMVIAFFFMAAGNMMNDYFDRELDKINHPSRPIPAGLIQPKNVIISVIIIYIVILILGIFINFYMVLILIIALVLMVSYELMLKHRGFIGNFTISVLVGLLFIFGAGVVEQFGVVIFLFLLAMLATLTREIVKDIEDIKGDLDRNTLPKRIGVKNASLVAGICIVIAVVLSIIPVYPQLLSFFEFNQLQYHYLYLIIPADLFFIISIYNFQKNPSMASQTLKIGMVIALIAFAFGSITI